jgi:hypothetical protein
MAKNRKQLILGATTLICMLAGFRGFDAFQGNKVRAHLAKAQSSVLEQKPQEVQKELQAIEQIFFITPAARSAFDEEIAGLKPALQQLEDQTTFSEQNAELERIRLMMVRGELAEAGAALKDAPSTANFKDPAIAGKFAAAVQSMATDLARLMELNQHHAEPTDLGEAWQDLFPVIETLAEQNERFTKAPTSKWIGEDRKSIGQKKKKLNEKAFMQFVSQQDLRKSWLSLDELEIKLEQKIEAYLIEKEKAPEEAHKLSLKTTRAEYDQKIVALRQELEDVEAQRSSAAALYLEQRGIETSASTLSQYIEHNGLVRLFCQDYSLLSSQGLQRLKDMRAETSADDALRARIDRMRLSLIEHWAAIIEQEFRSEYLRHQALSTSAATIQAEALQMLDKPDEIQDWLKHTTAVLQAATQWQRVLITHP